MADDRRTADELHAAAVRDAVARLNAVMGAAWDAGLAIEIETPHLLRIDRRDPIPIVEVQIRRPL